MINELSSFFDYFNSSNTKEKQGLKKTVMFFIVLFSLFCLVSAIQNIKSQPIISAISALLFIYLVYLFFKLKRTSVNGNKKK